MPWSKAFGAYGYRARLYTRGRQGRLYLSWQEPGRGKQRLALGHSDRTLAEQDAREKVAELLARSPLAARALTVEGLLLRYEREVSKFKKGAQLAEDRRRRRIWTAFLGADRPVQAVDLPTLQRFERERRAGTLAVPDCTLARHPSARTVAADVVYLVACYNWATTVALPGGKRLLEHSPIRGYRTAVVVDPKRPIATYDRYLAVRRVADQVDPQRRFGAFLDLVEALGWRVSAICQLRAGDADLRRQRATPHGQLCKRGATDKEGVEQWVPLPVRARRALARVWRVSLPPEAPLFPSPRRPGQCWTRWHARDLLERAEAAARLPPLPGGDFHPYRRKWATERKHLPTPDVMLAGGWRDQRSLTIAYQRPDQATMLRVLREPRKLRDPAVK